MVRRCIRYWLGWFLRFGNQSGRLLSWRPAFHFLEVVVKHRVQVESVGPEGAELVSWLGSARCKGFLTVAKRSGWSVCHRVGSDGTAVGLELSRVIERQGRRVVLAWACQYGADPIVAREAAISGESGSGLRGLRYLVAANVVELQGLESLCYRFGLGGVLRRLEESYL